MRKVKVSTDRSVGKDCTVHCGILSKSTYHYGTYVISILFANPETRPCDVALFIAPIHSCQVRRAAYDAGYTPSTHRGARMLFTDDPIARKLGDSA